MNKVEKRLYEILNILQHKRFKNIETICQRIKLEDDIVDVGLYEGKGDIICDDYLIGTITIKTKNNDRLSKYFVFDFQLFYIKDNLENYYITEVELLEEIIQYI